MGREIQFIVDPDDRSKADPAVKEVMWWWCPTRLRLCPGERGRSPARRAARRRNLLHSPRGPNRHRELAAPLQHDQAARIGWIQAASTGGICPCLRRVAGCATPTGSAGHASAAASPKLTFHLDHSVGANQPRELLDCRLMHSMAEWDRALRVAAWLSENSCGRTGTWSRSS